MPAAIPRTGATRLSPRRSSRCGSQCRRPPGLSINPSKIDGGSPNNVVPDLAILRVNMRPRTPDDRGRLPRADCESARRDRRAARRRHRGARRVRPAAKTADQGSRGAFQSRQESRSRPWPADRLAAVRRGVRRQQYRRLRRACRRHDGRARRQDPQHGGISDRRSLRERATLSALTILRLASEAA